MRTASRGALAFSLALLLLPVAGCSVKTFQIRLASFQQSDTNGIWLWRRQSTGTYARACRIEISEPYLLNGTEIVSYDQTCPGGGANGTPMMARVQRLKSKPDQVTLSLLFQTDGVVGIYRATAYNGAAESALSSTFVQL